MDVSRIPERNEIPVEYTWDLTDIFPDDEAWAFLPEPWAKDRADS